MNLKDRIVQAAKQLSAHFNFSSDYAADADSFAQREFNRLGYSVQQRLSFNMTEESGDFFDVSEARYLLKQTPGEGEYVGVVLAGRIRTPETAFARQHWVKGIGLKQNI